MLELGITLRLFDSEAQAYQYFMSQEIKKDTMRIGECSDRCGEGTEKSTPTGSL